MVINFDTLRQQDVDKSVLIDLLEHFYNKLKENKDSNIIINELCKVNRTTTNEYNIELSNIPLSMTDILIVSQDGSITITPMSLTKIENNLVYISNKNMKMLDYVYVTYKY